MHSSQAMRTGSLAQSLDAGDEHLITGPTTVGADNANLAGAAAFTALVSLTSLALVFTFATTVAAAAAPFFASLSIGRPATVSGSLSFFFFSPLGADPLSAHVPHQPECQQTPGPREKLRSRYLIAGFFFLEVIADVFFFLGIRAGIG